MRAVCIVGLGAFLSVIASLSLALENRPIPIATASFPPFEFERDGNIVGSDTDIIRAAFREMGEPVDIALLPWKRVVSMTLSGQLAGLYSITPSPEREADYWLSGPISTVQDVFFQRKSSAIRWKEVKDLTGFALGYSEGYSYAPELQSLIKGGQFGRSIAITHETPEYQGLKLLAVGRVDIFICEISVCSYLIQSHPEEFSELEAIHRPVGPVRTFHLGFSRSWPGSEGLVKRFNQALEAVAASGERDVILQEYGLSYSP